MSSSSRSETFWVVGSGEFTACWRAGGELAQIFLHGQHQGDIVVDGEDADGCLPLIPDVDSGGLQGLAVGDLGQIAQPVLRDAAAVQRFQRHMGGTVPYLAAGDVSVLNGHDGAVRIVGLEVVDDHLAAGAELGGQGFGQPEQELDHRRVQIETTSFKFRISYSIVQDSHIARKKFEQKTILMTNGRKHYAAHRLRMAHYPERHQPLSGERRGGIR